MKHYRLFLVLWLTVGIQESLSEDFNNIGGQTENENDSDDEEFVASRAFELDEKTSTELQINSMLGSSEIELSKRRSAVDAALQGIKNIDMDDDNELMTSAGTTATTNDDTSSNDHTVDHTSLKNDDETTLSPQVIEGIQNEVSRRCFFLNYLLETADSYEWEESSSPSKKKKKKKKTTTNITITNSNSS